MGTTRQERKLTRHTLFSSYRGGRIGPVQAVLAKRLAEVDPGKVVRHKERQPYVIV
jgi:hypothetical protein